MACCTVKTCLNSRKFPSQGKKISFHMFPKGDLQKVWLELIGKSAEGWIWSKNKIICSEHFNEECFVEHASKRFLKSNAVPSLKLGRTLTDPSISLTEPSVIKVEPAATLDISTTNSSVNVSSEQLIEFIKTIHSYSISPTKIMKQYVDLRRRHVLYRKRLYQANKQIKSLKKKLLNMTLVLEYLKEKQMESMNTVDDLGIIRDLKTRLLNQF